MNAGGQIFVTLFQDHPWVLVFGGLLLGDVFAWRDLSYSVRGRTVDAVVTKSQVEKYPGLRRPIPKRVVRYSFRDHVGIERDGIDHVPPNTDVPLGEMVTVQYLPGRRGASRLVQPPRWWAVVCLAGTLVVPVLFWMRMHRAAHAPLTWRGRRVRRPPTYRFR